MGCRWFTKGEENCKIKLYLVEIAAVSTVGERTEMLFFNVLMVSCVWKIFVWLVLYFKVPSSLYEPLAQQRKRNLTKIELVFA